MSQPVESPEIAIATAGTDRSHRQRPLIYFCLVHLLVGALMAVASNKNGPSPSSVAMFGLAMSQISLLCAWCALAPVPLPISVMTLLVVSTLLSVELGLGIGELSLWTMTIGVGSALLGSAVLFAWRLVTHASFQHLRHDPNSLREDRLYEALQFEIRHLLYLTAAIAVLAAAVRQGLAVERSSISSVWIICGTMAVTTSIIGVVCAWAVLGLGNLGRRLVLAFFVSAAVGGIGGAIIGRHSMVFAMVAWTQAGCLLVSLAILRGLGYRLLRPQGSA